MVRQGTGSRILAGCIYSILITIFVVPLRGWFLMLAVGILHAEWWPALPTIGYWWACLAVLLLNGVFSSLPDKPKDES